MMSAPVLRASSPPPHDTHALVSSPPAMSHSPKVHSHPPLFDVNTSVVDGSTSLHDDTLVAEAEDGVDREKVRGEAGASAGGPVRRTLWTGENIMVGRHSNAEDTDAGEKHVAHWDPLQSARSEAYSADITGEDKEEEVVDESGRVLFSNGPVSRRTSHLRLDLKPPSPQPWDLADPESHKSAPDFYSSVGSRKFDTLQNTKHARPLIPKSSYYFGPPPSDSAYGTHPIGHIGVHHPREILRIERDYTGGELTQFASIYPLELEGRITPTQFLESINAINELLISAHSLRHSLWDNILVIFTFQISKLLVTSHYQKEMQRLQLLLDDLNTGIYNPVGLNILWPGKVAFLYLEIEYY